MLGIDGPGKDITDLTIFEEGVGQMPGIYHVDVIVNNATLGAYDISFAMQKNASGQDELQPCISSELLKQIGIKSENYPGLDAGAQCVNLSAIPMARTEFVFNRQQLLITIPQAAINTQARGYVSPERLDEGINALSLNYSFTGANTEARQAHSTDSDSYYLNLRPGLNIGPWRLRNYSTWTRNTSNGDTQDSWESVYTYAQRNIIALKSQLTLGDSSSPSDMFDAVPFRGAQLASDDDMLPD
ncbi:fimbrial assembly protein, partial [Klebsiella aerogenes]